MKTSIKLALIIAVICVTACSKSGNSGVQKEKNKVSKDSSQTGLPGYDLEEKSPKIIKLPDELKEISGITITPDGRLFAQQDEFGYIYQIDLTNGNIIKRFALGNPVIKGDFEDLTYINGKFYMLRSDGDLFEFSEGKDGESVEYNYYKTALKRSNDVEGLCYDPLTNSLLLACKGESGTGDSKEKSVYSFSLDSMKLNDSPRFTMQLSEIKKNFHPSGIQYNPKTGRFYIIAAAGSEIIEIDKDGKIIGSNKLHQSIHEQPEGIAFGPDNTLYISNEGKSGSGYIVAYPAR